MERSAEPEIRPVFTAPSPMSIDATIIANHATHAKLKAGLYFATAAALSTNGYARFSGAKRKVHKFEVQRFVDNAESMFCKARQMEEALHTFAARIPETPYGDDKLDIWLKRLLEPGRKNGSWRRDSWTLLDHVDAQLSIFSSLMVDLRQKATKEQIDTWHESPAVEREEEWKPVIEGGLSMARGMCRPSIARRVWDGTVHRLRRVVGK